MSTLSWSLLRKIIVRYVVNRAAGSYCLRSILLDCETWFVRVLQQVRGVVEVSSPGACSRSSGRVHTVRHGLHLRTHRLLLHCCWLLPQGLTAWRVISYAHTHTRPFNGPLSWTTRVSRYQKGKTNLDITEARDSEWQWHQLGHMQVCTSLQTDNHASTPTT